MTAYYNENDPYAAQWLRNLVSAGLIAPGDVDDRSIKDVRADDLVGYRQCHFFAGIGIWSYALRQAGWPDDQAVWTGSCPCQPFSGVGKREGTDDPRHLWPDWFGLISERSPDVVFGEQVASKDGEAWLDLVQTDMESLDYAFGPIVSPAAGYGAPHGRHRIYFVGDSEFAGLEGYSGDGNSSSGRTIEDRSTTSSGSDGRLGDTPSNSIRTLNRKSRPSRESQEQNRGSSFSSGLGDPDSDRCAPRGEAGSVDGHGHTPEPDGRIDRGGRPGPTNGIWSDPDWLFCRDGKWRAVESGTFPLADGIAGRVGRLHAYGNAIVAPQASEFVSAYMDTDQTGQNHGS